MITKKKTSLDICFGLECNLNCDQCCMGGLLNKGTKIDYRAIVKYIERHPEINEIYLSGGELLCDFEEYLLFLLKRFPERKWKCTTNLAYRLTPIRIEILKRITCVQVSFDIGSVRFHNIKTLLTWYHNLKTLLSFKQNVDIGVCLTKHVINKGPEAFHEFFTKLHDKFGLAAYSFLIMSKCGNLKKNYNTLMPNKKETTKFLKDMLNIENVMELNDTVNNIANGSLYSCYFVTTLNVMRNDGELCNCIFEQYNDKPCVVSDNCLSCDYYKHCGGICDNDCKKCYFDKSVYNKALSVIKKYNEANTK